MPFIFWDLAILVLQSAKWQLYCKAWYFWDYTYSERFDTRALFVLFTVTEKIHLAQNIKMILNRVHFRAIIFYNFRHGFTQQQSSMNLMQFLVMKLHQGSVVIDGVVNLTEVVVHSKTNFVKNICFVLLQSQTVWVSTDFWLWPVFIDGVVNSTEVVIRSKTNFVKNNWFVLLQSQTVWVSTDSRLDCEIWLITGTTGVESHRDSFLPDIVFIKSWREQMLGMALHY